MSNYCTYTAGSKVTYSARHQHIAPEITDTNTAITPSFLYKIIHLILSQGFYTVIHQVNKIQPPPHPSYILNKAHVTRSSQLLEV